MRWQSFSAKFDVTKNALAKFDVRRALKNSRDDILLFD
jgi:hypothetical protein